jgi:YVTN family beta-propeller protein
MSAGRCGRGAGRAGWSLWLALCFGIAAIGLAASAGVIHADGGAPNLAYVVGGGASRTGLVIIDIAKRRVTGQVTIGGDPHGLALSLDGRFVYVTQTALDRLAVVDARTLRVTTTLPAGHGPVAVALEGAVSGDLFVADAAANTVTVLDPRQLRVLATIPVGQYPMSVAVASPTSGISNPNDPEIYVANAQSATISVISATRHQVVATIPAPGGPVGVVVPGADGVAYVATRAGTILALSLADHRLLGTLLQLRSGAPGAMDYDALTGEIYVPDPAGEVIWVLRPARAGAGGAVPVLPAEPARGLPISGGPAAVAITFEGSLGFVAERDAGQVLIFDVATHQTLATLAVGGAPRAIMTGAYPPVPAPTATGAGWTLGWVLGGVVILALAGFGLRWFAIRGFHLRSGTGGH